MNECNHCGVEFTVEFEIYYKGADIKFCPCCGEPLVEELDFDE